MNLTQLVKYLINPEELDILYTEMKVNIDFEALLIYMKDSLDLKSDIIIFELEETEDRLDYSKNGNNYHQLFPVDLAVDLTESDLELKGRGCSDEYIATRLLEYRLNDA